MALLGSLAAVRAQLADPARFAAAFACVEACLRRGGEWHARLEALADGQTERAELEGGAFALLQAYRTKPKEEGRWETHRAHVDVQALTAGRERMETADFAGLELEEDLTPGKDVIFYRPFPRGSSLLLEPGVVAVYFPADAHLGQIAVAGPELVRKVVVKVPLAR
jgi:biofilm protein TabA